MTIGMAMVDVLFTVLISIWHPNVSWPMEPYSATIYTSSSHIPLLTVSIEGYVHDLI